MMVSDVSLAAFSLPSNLLGGRAIWGIGSAAAFLAVVWFERVNKWPTPIAGVTDKVVSVHFNPGDEATGLLWEDEVLELWWSDYWAAAR